MAEFALHTPRLVLREWREADFAPFLAMSLDPEVMRYFPPTDAAGVRALIERQRTAQATHGHCFWAAERRDDGAFAGVIGLGPPRAFKDGSALAEVELGWRLARDQWGQGLATEGAAAVRDWAFAVLDSPSLIAITVLENRPSRAVMDRLGMVHAPAEDFDHPDLPADSPLRRHVLYRLSRPA